MRSVYRKLNNVNVNFGIMKKVKTKRTYQEIFNFNKVAVKFLKEKPKSFTSVYIKKISESVDAHGMKYQELCDDVELSNAAFDPETQILLTNDKGGYKFTVEGSKKVRNEIKKLSDKVVEFETYMIEEEEVLNKYDINTVKAFSEILIDKKKAQELLKKLEDKELLEVEKE